MTGKKYLLRMLVFALISEIPFNYLYYSSPVFPFHQNVMFTFFIALLLMLGLEKLRGKGTGVYIIAAALSLPVGYFLRNRHHGGLLRQRCGHGADLLSLPPDPLRLDRRGGGTGLPELQAAGRHDHPSDAGKLTLEFPEQGLALLALIPIWLYNGRQGAHNKAIQYACYLFYPAHMLILALLRMYL